MLYFAFGSNLYRKQMKKRCKDSKYLKPYILKSHTLSFSHMTNKTIYGHANILKKSNSTVPGAIWFISKKDEKSLDFYEGVNYKYYSKKYFKINKKRVLVYIQNKYFLKKPNSTYLHTIIQGYKDCNLDKNYLFKILMKKF